MSTKEVWNNITLVAGADLSAKQYYLVKSSSGAAALGTAGDLCLGSLQNKPTSGQAATVQFGGVAKVSAGAAVAQDAFVTSDANGQGVTATTGDNVFGQALEAASNADEIIRVAILHAGVSD